MNGAEIGSGKHLNFVNEGKLYDGSKWEELKKNQPFFAQLNTLECEYDIYDRNTWPAPSGVEGERNTKKLPQLTM